MRKIDLTGRKFGKWTVVSEAGRRLKRIYWLCECSCGRTVTEVDGAMLRKGESTQCKLCGYEPVPGRYGGKKGQKMERENLVGQRFRMLTVIAPAENIGKHPAWLCRCDCKTEKVIREFSLKSGRIKSCGCESTLYRPKKQLSGQRFGFLTAVRPGPRIGNHAAWICVCDCDETKELNIREFFLTKGRQKSCGCHQYDGLKVRNVKHDMSRTREYRIWLGIRRRCNDPKHPGYKNYGGRGIRICKEYDDSFEVFFKEVGFCPKPHYTVDRINNGGHYEPGNVHWVSMKRNMRNRRNTSMITVSGKTIPMEDFADLIGINSKNIRYHLKRGKTIEEIMEHFEVDPSIISKL